MEIPSTIILLLLASQMPLLSNSHTMCDDELADINTIQSCISWYEQLLTATLTKENLYKLRLAFFPISRQQPTLMIVKYDIVLSRLCNETTIDMENETVKVTLGWSDSAIFTAINPLTLWETQAAILELFLPEKIYALHEVQLQLYLDSQNGTLNGAFSQSFNDSLLILTSRVNSKTHILHYFVSIN